MKHDYLQLAHEAYMAASDLRKRRRQHKRYTYGAQWDDPVTGPTGGDNRRRARRRQRQSSADQQYDTPDGEVRGGQFQKRNARQQQRRYGREQGNIRAQCS